MMDMNEWKTEVCNKCRFFGYQCFKTINLQEINFLQTECYYDEISLARSRSKWK